MSLKEEIQTLFKQYGLKPIKYRGQNFLVNRSVLKDIVQLAQIKPGDMVLEIGAGIGNLTEELLRSGARVMAVEKDKNLASILKKRLQNKNLSVVINDILKLSEAKIPSSYKIVGNIPYFITGPIIRKFLLDKAPPELLVLTIQKEVGERMVARAPKANFLSIMLQLLADVEIKKNIKSEDFWPQPKVDSVVVLIKPKKINSGVEKQIKFLKIGFKQPRKTLLNNLADAGMGDKQKLQQLLQEFGLSELVRAHELTLENWKRLYVVLSK